MESERRVEWTSDARVDDSASSRKAMIIAMLEKMRVLVLTPPDIAVIEGVEPKGFFVIAEGECKVRGRRADRIATPTTPHLPAAATLPHSTPNTLRPSRSTA